MNTEQNNKQDYSFSQRTEMKMIGQMDERRYKVIDVNPYSDKTEAYQTISACYGHMTGMTAYPVKDENGDTKYIIVQAHGLM